MKPCLSVITIGVNDLKKSVSFYEALGLHTEGIVGEELEYGAVAFFELQNGLRLALWPRQSIAHDTNIPVQAASATEFTLGHNVNSKDDVDVVMARSQKAGATVVKPASDTFWGGYAGYFQDPDGHLWEVVYNPDISV